MLYNEWKPMDALAQICKHSLLPIKTLSVSADVSFSHKVYLQSILTMINLTVLIHIEAEIHVATTTTRLPEYSMLMMQLIISSTDDSEMTCPVSPVVTRLDPDLTHPN